MPGSRERESASKLESAVSSGTRGFMLHPVKTDRSAEAEAEVLDLAQSSCK